MRLLHLLPTLPPPPEGVGTYALALAAALSRRAAVASRFLVGDPGWPAGGPRPAIAAEALPRRRAGDLERALRAAAAGDDTALLVHYANYGFARRGCPGWLIEGLARARAANPRRRLVTVFHEVYASGPPWRSSFWLAARQRRLAADLARLSDGLVTSLDGYAAVLDRWAGHPATVQPVCSTVGEPTEVPPLSARARRLVVFGGRGARRRALSASLPSLERACAALEIREVWEVGWPRCDGPASVAGRPRRSLGELAGEEVSRLLLGSVAGFLAYPPAFLPKSTIFAAYAAHGVLAVCGEGAPASRGAPAAGHHYLAPAAGEHPSPDRLQAIADAARAWYAEHSLARQAEVFHRLLWP